MEINFGFDKEEGKWYAERGEVKVFSKKLSKDLTVVLKRHLMRLLRAEKRKTNAS